MCQLRWDSWRRRKILMKLSRILINYCLIPILCIVPIFGAIACSVEEGSVYTANAVEKIGNSIVNFPENLRTAAPYMQEDVTTWWCEVSGSAEAYAQEVGLHEPLHTLAVNPGEDKPVISGSSFSDVLRKARNLITPSDLNMNKVRWFLANENRARFVQTINRIGGRFDVGNVIFEIIPPVSEAPVTPPVKPLDTIRNFANALSSESLAAPPATERTGPLSAIRRIKTAITNNNAAQVELSKPMDALRSLANAMNSSTAEPRNTSETPIADAFASLADALEQMGNTGSEAESQTLREALLQLAAALKEQ